MTEQTPRPAAFCPSCGGALAPDGTHRPGRSRTIALVLLLVPMGVGLLGIHRIYMGLRSGRIAVLRKRTRCMASKRASTSGWWSRSR